MKASRILSVFIILIFISEFSYGKGISFSGWIARESIRNTFQSRTMKNGKMLEMGKEFATKPSVWKAPHGYKLTKFDIEGVPAELLEKGDGSDTIILQFHGGAYIIGLTDLYRTLAVRYCRLSKGASVLTIDYRVAPENTFPAALIDAYKAWEWLINKGYKPENIIIVGDSAGGNLTLALTAKLRNEGKQLPGALICMSPWADIAMEGESYKYNLHKDPMFGLKENEIIPEMKTKIVSYAGNTDPHDKYLSPVYGEFTNFPRMLIQVGTHEVLESDAITVYEKAKAKGVNVTLTRYEGMFHVFQIFGNFKESRMAWKEVAEFLNRN
ncbi:MAG: alpha/beta hydrolase [Prolixibacteraceae bacterium]|nr:alpha/beta hydrolase [Prolixibacteraceae bacterium]